MALIGFPNPVNEKAARTVAAGVVAMAAAGLAARQPAVLVPLVYGFWARVLTGPRLSPLGQLATKVVAPRLGPPRLVAGPPKRFAQGVGAVVTTSALVAWAAGALGLVWALLAAMVVAAGLEAAFGLCLGCKAFAVLIRLRVLPTSACAECGDLTLWRERQLALREG